MDTKTWHKIPTSEMNSKTLDAANKTLTWLADDTYTDWGNPELWNAFLTLADLKEVK